MKKSELLKFKLNINGNHKVIETDPSTPMLWVIRDELKLTGTKFGCGRGLCGACTIHLNGVELSLNGFQVVVNDFEGN